MRQAGFTLIEVLVAMVILAFGLLGIAGMQLSGIRNVQGSYLRSQGIAVVTDIAEKMHANRPGAKQGFYVDFDSSTVNCAAVPKICAQESGGTAPTACTAQEIATYDMFSVVCGVPNGSGSRVGMLTTTLPNGRIRISCISNSGAAVAAASCTAGLRQVIAVSWDDRSEIYQNSSTSNAIVTSSATVTLQP